MMSINSQEFEIPKGALEQKASEDREKKIAEYKKDLVKLFESYLVGIDKERFIKKLYECRTEFNLVAFDDWIRELRQVSTLVIFSKLIDQLFDPAI
jgi:hypothetical protein